MSRCRCVPLGVVIMLTDESPALRTPPMSPYVDEIPRVVVLPEAVILVCSWVSSTDWPARFCRRADSSNAFMPTPRRIDGLKVVARRILHDLDAVCSQQSE